MRTLALLAVIFTLTLSPTLSAQVSSPPSPAFEVATIKPHKPGSPGVVGFLSYPGGRIIVGYATVKMIAAYAFNVQEFQISGGPEWVGSDLFDVEALPPDTSLSRTAKQAPVAATPTGEQRKMLQTLLADRFGLKFHHESKEGSVYILTRGSKKLLLEAPKNKDADPRGAVMMKEGGIVDGEAFGQNMSMPFLARQLSGLLRFPVLDQTGLSGSYDFHLPPSDSTNTDFTSATFNAMDRLGLKLKRGKGPIDTLVIDRIERPSEN